jgi:hypothetical protein
MFDSLDEAALVAGVEEATRAEASAAARRFALIGELVTRRIGVDGDDPRALWACDGWDSAAAEIAAAMNIGHRKASGQMRIAEALRDHLPAVAALFRQGRLSSRVIAAITWRTRLITDAAVWALVDTAVAVRAQRWGPLSDEKLTEAVDALVHQFDPAAVINSQGDARSRDFTVGHYDDDAGVASVWGTLLAADAAVLDKKIAAIAATVCDNDPRTRGERRSDAAAALGHGNDHLVCRCGSPACPVAGLPAPKSSVLVTVVADQVAVDAAGQSLAQSRENPVASADQRHDMGTAMLGTAVLPTPMLAELLRNGAKLQPLCTPDDVPEPRYRPSARLARWVRARDLTCRFPGCTMAAEFCDIDHVIPYPIGATHPSNLACLCRKHHHLKTFWVGDWTVVLLADGTAIWTAPTGRTYTTYPGCRAFFPGWDTTTTELPPPPTAPVDTTPGNKVPTRKRTRKADRTARVNSERAHNNPDPPPF